MTSFIIFISEVFVFMIDNIFIDKTFLSSSMIIRINTTERFIKLFILMLASKLVIYILLKLFTSLVLEKKSILQNYSVEFRIIIAIMFMLLLFIAIVQLNLRGFLKNPIIFINLFIIILFSLSILFLFLFLRIAKTADEHIKRQKLVETLENKIKLNNTIETAEANLKALRHNFSNIFTVITGLLNLQEYSKLKEYINEINDDIYDAHKIVFLANKPLEILVNNKLNIAKQHNINFKTIISTHSITNFKNSDLCDIMGNIWDNAIDAATEEQGVKTIISIMNVQDGNYVITCENPYIIPPNRIGNKFISTKGENRGFGTKNVNAIVKKYNGNLKYEFRDGICNVSIKFPIKKLDENKIEIILNDV
ncbi:MAG: sensor histidine kinase [Bacilli bacterium]